MKILKFFVKNTYNQRESVYAYADAIELEIAIYQIDIHHPSLDLHFFHIYALFLSNLTPFVHKQGINDYCTRMSPIVL